MAEPRRRVATYERVSSEDQRERETIKTQTEALVQRLQIEPGVELVQRFVDDGVSGMIPMSDRPGGRQLLAAASQGLFDELWIYRIDRLGRDDVDPLVVWKEFDRLGIKVCSVVEGHLTLFTFHIHVAVAAEARRSFLDIAARGTARAAREVRYCGGIVSYGYRVDGQKQNARLVPDETIVWGDLSAADVVRKIFHWIAVDEWSARGVAEELNRLGVPTHYRKDGRGVRRRRTEGKWWPGRINSMANGTIYRGEYHYGKRSRRKDSRIITAAVPALVSDALWHATQETRGRRRRTPVGLRRPYLLRSLLRCGTCGLNYTGTRSRGAVWYRCNGQIDGSGPLRGRCGGKSVKGAYLEPTVRADIERFLSNPSELINELAEELGRDGDADAAVAEAERTTLEAALAALKAKHSLLLDLYLDHTFDRAELDQRRSRLDQQRHEIEKRHGAIETKNSEVPPQPVTPDLQAELRCRLAEGLNDGQWQEIASLLVRQITIHTTLAEDGSKQAKALVEYNFPAVGQTGTDRGSWRRSA